MWSACAASVMPARSACWPESMVSGGVEKTRPVATGLVVRREYITPIKSICYMCLILLINLYLFDFIVFLKINKKGLLGRPFMQQRVSLP